MNEVWNKLNFSEETISRIFSNIHYPGNNNECWEWVGYHNNRGYGNIGLFGTYHLAHRLVYQCYNGSISSNICVLHHCDNPKCVNPEHLFLGTRKDNINDMVNKHRQNSQKGSKHCNAKLTENDVVEMMVREALAENPSMDALQLVAAINSKLRAPANAPTPKRPRRPPKAEPPELPVNDLRRITAEGREKNLSAYDTLKAAGIIKTLPLAA